MADPAGEPAAGSPAAELTRMLLGFQESRAIIVAAELGLADLLAGGPRTVADLAAATATRPDLLRRLLRALAGRGVFAEEADGRFALSSLAEPLRTDAPGGSAREYALFLGQPFVQRPWEELTGNLRTGQPGFDRVYHARLFDYLAAHPADRVLFNNAMTSNTSREADAVIAAYDFAALGRIVDVAGGHGGLLSAILAASPASTGVLFDLPPVIAAAPAASWDRGVADRCELVGGDMFAAVPPGADAYTLQRTLHDWEDEQAAAILRNCRDGMNDGGRILIVEMVVPAGNVPHLGKYYDLTMMVMLGGRERTEDEFAALLAAAGLDLARIIPTRSAVSIIEAVRPQAAP
jgi:O-methyltransferase domain/Dimerisation domain